MTENTLGDTLYGVRWRVVDACATDIAYLPTMTLRVGGMLRGPYDEGRPEDFADGASGVETSLLMGKAFGSSGLGLYGGITGRFRTEADATFLVTHVPRTWGGHRRWSRC